ncbi:MAG: hypothetical protein SLAVMIC_00282 [uncultured marine phage]|uniref:Uncharacterized protein n=1 Tax=uncultured marine phage TaxID=707152 RepID=A0A8D9FQY0_9VIRU|nr:MAG: hypothetical protein SLAVMIC_00282 [uncultured marine phage]
MSKYLKTYRQYKIFEADRKLDYEDTEKETVKVATDSLNDLAEQIKDFNNKKSNLEKLVMDNRGEDAKDISKNIEDIIMDKDMGRNPFLSMYLTIVEKMRKVANLQDKIDYFNQLENERKGDVTASKNLSDATDREEQQQKLNTQIEDIHDKVREMRNEIDELEKEIAQNKSELDKFKKDSEKDFEEDIDATQWTMKDKD